MPLARIREDNFRILELYSRLLNFSPRLVTERAVRELTGPVSALSADVRASIEESAVYGLLTALLGMEDGAFSRAYLLPSLKMLSAAPYKKDAYYKKIRFPAVKRGEWELGYEAYEPYELFVWNDIEYFENGKELPRIGFFTERFAYPAVKQNGREWMTVTPNEIETMKEPLAASRGKVLTYGLGLGYFAFMASERDEVEQVTVVERDASVISLFREFILPSFPHKQKIRIIETDALDFAEHEAKGFDMIFADIWHDASDGLPLYLRLKRAERYAEGADCHYWIEKTLLSYLRTRRLAALEDKGLDESSLLEALSPVSLIRAAEEGLFDPLS